MQEKLENTYISKLKIYLQVRVCTTYVVHKNGEILNKLELPFKRIDFVPKGNQNSLHQNCT